MEMDINQLEAFNKVIAWDYEGPTLPYVGMVGRCHFWFTPYFD